MGWEPVLEIPSTQLQAYPGICLFDKLCWGNTRGMFHQWYYTSDTSPRAAQIWGDKPELWDFSKQDDADLVIINLGTNDSNEANNVTSAEYVAQYTLLIEGIHAVWPNAQIVLIHNDIGPAWHPTDVGHIKIASHLIQYVKLNFGWELYATGPEVFHDTLYWNDNQSY
ncbi:hypothetical protein DID88_005683 [Monilinia fructigena]|uniref:SGNH hydrolase-type esterase domain-containing protein n=1 Tax=Monilinia fructigena TaxID=38457 RepID=A0A395J0J7_9HELO|nr:hypothetical protein DID88_005683 [Monilinia fructigena]